MMANPVRLTASAARQLPRLSLLVLLAAYAIPGLFGRDPWRGDDAIGFGVMLTMAQGSLTDWLVPNVAGELYAGDGPLMFWVGALCIKALSWLMTPDDAARVSALLAMTAAAFALWYATYLLGRRVEAQPQQFAFGGQPDARDYGRALADGALLLTVGTLGLLLRAHESSSQIATFAAWCVGALGLVRTLDQPRAGAIWTSVSMLALVLTQGIAAAMVVLASAILLWVSSSHWRRAGLMWWVVALGLVALPAAAWTYAVHSAPSGDAWIAQRAQGHPVGPWILNTKTWIYYLSSAPWFVWPSWPMAIWGLYIWRRQWRAAHILLPLGMTCAALAYFAIGHPPSDSALLALIVPTVLLAAFGLPALQRSVANLVDWFALVVFSVFGVMVWSFWLGMLMGAPEWVAGRMQVVLPGFTPTFNAIWFLVAMVSTVLWAALVRWRIRSRPVMVWRSAVMSAAGLALVWALFMSLLMPAADYRKTYRYVASAVSQQVTGGACIRSDHLDLSQRSAIAYHGALSFGEDCEWLLHYQDAGKSAPEFSATEWTLVWKGNRAVDRKERFWLFRRVAVPAGPAAVLDAAMEEDPVQNGHR